MNKPMLNTMFFTATVRNKQALSPGMLRLTFDGLGEMPGTGIPDEYLRLFFPNRETGRLHLPHIDADGRWTYPDGGQKAICCSTYTVRHHRPERGEIDVDFVVHEGGVASDWAQAAAPGDTITVNRPRGLYTPPADMAWQLLVCDATGLPALARILDQTPEHVQSRVFVEVAEPGHQLALPAHPGASVTWLHRSGNGIAPSRIAEVVRSTRMPDVPAYVWVAGEQRAVRAVRKYVRQDLKLPPERYELVGYWTHEGEAWEAQWEGLPAEIKAEIDAVWDSGRDIEDARDAYYAILEKFGL